MRVPSLRLHKPSGLAVATFNGKDIYFGKHGSPEAIIAYNRALAEFVAHGKRLPVPDADITINEVLVAYLTHAETYYRKNGVPTLEIDNIKHAIKPLRVLYGSIGAADFTPASLRTIQNLFVEQKLCRNEVNRRVSTIRRVFKWAVAAELVPASVLQAIACLPPLKRGRTAARETEPVRPVSDANVEAIKPFVSLSIWTMLALQRLTAMRPGEVCCMRACDIDMTGEVWVYVPETHKTEHHNIARRIFLGPRAIEALKPMMPRDPTAYIFSPARVLADRAIELRAKRKSPVQPSQVDRRSRARSRAPGQKYDTRAYARAIRRGCAAAGVPIFGPNRLRHLAATNLRREFGLDVARVVLGHSDAKTTLIYAERDLAAAARAMAAIG